MTAFQYLKGSIGKMGKIFSGGLVAIGQGAIALFEGRVKHWDRFPREVMEAPSLETFKARLDGALSNLVWLKMSLLTAGGLG